VIARTIPCSVYLRYDIQSTLCVIPRFIRYLRLFFASTPCSVYLRPLYVLAVTPSSQTSVYYRASFDTSVFSLHRPLVPFTSDHYTCLPLRHPVKPLCTTALHSIPPSFLCIDRHMNSCTCPPRPFCPPSSVPDGLVISPPSPTSTEDDSMRSFDKSSAHNQSCLPMDVREEES
jgi:hypothetical protein